MRYFLIILGIAFVALAQTFSYSYIERGVPEVRLEGNRAFVTMAGCERSLPGQHDLPARIINIALPKGMRASSLEFSVREELLLSSVSVEAVRDDGEFAEWPFTKADPPRPAELVGTGLMFGRPIAQVRLSPVRFDASNGALFVAKSYELEFELESWDHEAILPATSTPSSARLRIEILQEAVVNPQDADLDFPFEPMDEMKPFVRSFPPALGDDPADGVVIIAERFARHFEGFIFDEIAFGLALEIIPLEALYSAYPHGIDRAERIRNFIRDAYQKWGISGVFLVGNIDELPVRYRYGTTAIPTWTEVPTDLYFSVMDGDWNTNGDRFFGEQDEDDYFPELFVGRFQPEDTSEVIGFIEKLRAHRRGLEPDFARRWLFACASLSPTSGDRIGQVICDSLIDTYLPTGIEALKMYSYSDSTGGDMELNKSNFIRELEIGRYLICHIDHGYQYHLHTGKHTGGGGLTIEDFFDLENSPYFPILYTFSCEVNAIDLSSIGSAAIRAPDAGVVAVFAHSRSAWTSQIGLVYSVWANQLLPYSSIKLGQILQGSILGMSDNSVYRYYKAITTLFGYPFLDIFPRGIRPINISLSSDTVSREASVIMPSVTDAISHMPLAGVTVVARTPAGSFAMGTTDAGGATRLVVRPGEADFLYISAFGNGAGFAEETLHVADPPRAFVVVEDVHFKELSGDGDDSFEPGDTFVCDIRFKNCGTFTADTVRITLQNCDAVDSLEYLFGLASGDTITIPSAFSLAAKADIRGKLNLRPIVKIETAGRISYDTLSIQVDGPILRHFSTEYSSRHGTMPSAGDTSRILIGVTNIGFGDFHGARVFLRVFGATLDASEYFVGTIAPEDTFKIPLEIIADGPLVKGWAAFEFSNAEGETVFFERNLPDAPESLMIEPAVSSIRLYWKASSDSSISGYNIYRRARTEGSHWRLINVFPVPFSTFIDEDLPHITQYFYRATAVDRWLNESQPSDSVLAWTTLPQLDGWPRSVGPSIRLYSSPVLFDFDRDGTQEVYIAAQNYSAVYAFHSSGEDVRDSTSDVDPFTILAWRDSLPAPEGVWGSPALGDLTGDGDFELFVNHRDLSRRLFVLDPSTAEPEAGWPIIVPMHSMGSPVLADINRDGWLELINPSFEGLDIFRPDGSPYIPGSSGRFFRGESGHSGVMFGSPAVGDLDGDGAVEIVFGGPADSLGQGTLWALRTDGSVLDGWPIRLPWADFSGLNPVIANFDSDTTTLEVLAPTRLRGVYIFKHDGSVLEGWPVEGYYFWEFASNCAAADFDRDGICEVVISGSYTVGIHSASGTPLPGWPITLGSSTDQPGCASIGDIDGDGTWDLVYALGDRIYAFSLEGQPVPGFPLVTKDMIYTTPTLGDIDGDGTIEIVAGSFDSKVYIWKTGAPYCQSALAWPTHKGNFRRTGRYGDHLEQLAIGENRRPKDFSLTAYPNPFNSALVIWTSFSAEVSVYDITGKLTAHLSSHNEGKNREECEFVWRPEAGQPSGVYFIKAKYNYGIDNAVVRAVYLK